MARSLAFWFDEEGSTALPKLELHINFWSLDSEDTNFLDIGVRINKESAGITFKNLNIYIPFEVNQENYLPQLGQLVCSDRELISAIFNSNVTTTTATSKNDILEITFSPENKLSFYTQILPEENNSNDGVRVKSFKEYGNSHKGTILCFPQALIDSSSKETDSYFRFRIKLDKESKSILGPEYSPKDSWFTNYFESTEMVDFRINEPRNLPAKIRSNLNEKLGLKDVHFFLIRDANSEFKISHSKYKRCRILENDIWRKYLQTSNQELKLPEQMLIYHWAESKGKAEKDKDKVIEYFSAFAKFTKRKVGIWKILGVIFFVFFIGVMSGLTANIIWNFNEDSVESDVSGSESSNLTKKQELELEKQAPIAVKTKPNEDKQKIENKL